MRGSVVSPWSRLGRVRWSKESELELELSPGSLRTICLGAILPARQTDRQTDRQDEGRVFTAEKHFNRIMWHILLIKKGNVLTN